MEQNAAGKEASHQPKNIFKALADRFRGALTIDTLNMIPDQSQPTGDEFDRALAQVRR